MLLTILSSWRTLNMVYLIVAINFLVVGHNTRGEDAEHYSTTLGKSGETPDGTVANRGRYLVFPEAGTNAPTKVQLITGLGIPMEVDVSMILGYVIKFVYVLPTNASYLTHPYDARRHFRSIETAKNYEYEQEEGAAEGDDADEVRRRGSTSRWEIYRVIVTVLDGFQVSGKGCLLKMVCQVAQVPFETTRAGIIAQLIHVLLTPSTTREKYQVSGDQEFHSAEEAGRDNPGKCEDLFPECHHNLLEYFTETTTTIEEEMGRQFP